MHVTCSTDWALSMMPSLVKKVTDKTAKEFFSSQPDQPKALLFTKKLSTAPVFKALSTKLKDRMILAEVHEKEHKTLDQFGVSSDDLPLLLAFPKGTDASDPSAAAIRYSGMCERCVGLDLTCNRLDLHLTLHAQAK
jgi:hypothetical protein